MAVNSGSPNVNPNANPSVNTNPAPPPPPAGIGSGPTGNSGFSQNESTMAGLQGRAGDMQARLSNISSGLRGLNLGMNSLGPIGLFAVPALNNSNDNAVAQAERGSKAFGDVQQGLRATQQVTVASDTNNASAFRGIDPNNTFKPVPGAANSIAPPPKQGGAQVSQRPNIPGASGPAPAPTRTAGGPTVSTAPNVPGANSAPRGNVGGPVGSNVGKPPTIPVAGTTPPGGKAGGFGGGNVGAVPTIPGGATSVPGGKPGGLGGGNIGVPPTIPGVGTTAPGGKAGGPGGKGVGAVPTIPGGKPGGLGGGTAGAPPTVPGSGSVGPAPTVPGAKGGSATLPSLDSGGGPKNVSSALNPAAGQTGGAPMAPGGGASPGGQSTDRSSKFTAPGAAKGAFDVPKAPVGDGTISKAPVGSPGAPTSSAPGGASIPKPSTTPPVSSGTSGFSPPTTPKPDLTPSVPSASAGAQPPTGVTAPGFAAPTTSGQPGGVPMAPGGGAAAPGGQPTDRSSKFTAPGAAKGAFDLPKSPIGDGTISKAPVGTPGAKPAFTPPVPSTTGGIETPTAPKPTGMPSFGPQPTATPPVSVGTQAPAAPPAAGPRPDVTTPGSAAPNTATQPGGAPMAPGGAAAPGGQPTDRSSKFTAPGMSKGSFDPATSPTGDGTISKAPVDKPGAPLPSGPQSPRPDATPPVSTAPTGTPAPKSGGLGGFGPQPGAVPPVSSAPVSAQPSPAPVTTTPSQTADTQSPKPAPVITQPAAAPAANAPVDAPLPKPAAATPAPAPAPATPTTPVITQPAPTTNTPTTTQPAPNTTPPPATQPTPAPKASGPSAAIDDSQHSRTTDPTAPAPPNAPRFLQGLFGTHSAPTTDATPQVIPMVVFTPPANTNQTPTPTPTPTPTTPAPTQGPPPGPVPVLPSHGNLPAFFQQSQALGTIAPSNVNGGARITAAVNGLLPPRAGVTPVGVDDIETALNQNFESFLGNGRKFPVKVGRNWYEATVRANLDPPVDPNTAVTVPDTKTKVDMTVNSGNATAHTGTVGTSATVGVGGVISAGVGPYGAASVSVPLGRPVESSTTSTSTTDQRIIRSGEGSVDAVVPVTYTVSLTDAQNNPVGAPVTVTSTPAADVDVTLHIPDDLSTITPPAVAPTPVVPANGWGAALEHPAPEAVVDLDTDAAFATVAAQLHPSITRLGAPGRTALQNFLDPTTIRDNLGPALNGWVVSPDLVGPHGSRAGVVRMKATPVSAELVGTNPSTVLRLHESTATSTGSSSATKSGFDVTVGVGGGAVAPNQVGGTGGVTAGYSAKTTESSNAGTNSSVKTGVQIKGDTGLYKVTVNLEIQTPHGATITVPATSYLRLGVPEASSAGLQVPPGTPPNLTTPTPTPRFAPPYLAAATAAGNVKVGEFAPANQVQGQVEDALRGLPGFDSFLPSFADPNSNPRDIGRNASDLADQMANQRKLTTELSPTALKSQMDSLLGPGVQVQLKKQGLATNEYVNVTVKARVTNPVHLGQTDARNVRGAASTGPKLDSSTTTQKGWSAGVEGRVVIPSTTGGTSASPTPAVGAKYNSGTSTKNAAGPTVSSTALNVGSPNSQLFQHDVAFDIEVTKFTQNRAWVKRMTPGSPFLKVPEPTTVAKTSTAAQLAPANAVRLPEINGTVNLWVSDSSAMKSDPAVFAPGAATVAPAPNTTISTMLTSPKPAVEPWLHVEAVANTEAVRAEAIAALNRAANGDSALSVPGTEARNRIDKLFSPESMKANLRTLVDKGVTEGGMKYGRRVADRTGAVGMSVALTNPKLVSISDDTGTENANTGGFKAGDSKTGAQSVDLTAGINTPMKPTTGATGSGAIGATAKWTPWSKSSTEANEIGGSVDRNKVTPSGGRTVLVQLDADITVVGESRSGNTLYGGTPRSSASVVTLPGGVFVRVSEDTARGMKLLPPLPAHATPSMGTMTPPSTLRPGEPGALGLGLVERVPNLSGLVPALRTDLGALGADLMPPSVLKDSMNNLQRLTDLTSEASVKALMDSALDGGVPLLVHNPGVFGKDTYQVTLKATLGAPTFDGVVNDGVEMEHTTTGTAKISHGQGKGTAWGVSLRVPGSGLPATGNPNLSGSAGGVAAVGLGQAHSNSTTDSTTEQVGHLRAGSGPAVKYTVPVTFELVVEKGNQVVGRASSGLPQDMSVRLLADNQKITGATPANTTAFAPTTAPQRPTQGNPAAANFWQANPSPATPTAAPAVLPPTASVENLRGAQALQNAAISALTAAGANQGITGKGTGSMNALQAGLSSESLQPNLPGMLKGALEVPGLHEAALTVSQHANVKVYAKLVNPRLEGLSDGVNLENPKTTVTTTSSDSKHSDTGDFAIGAGSGGVKSGNPDVGFTTGGIEGKHAGEDSSATSGGTTDNKVTNLKPQGRSGLVTYDVEYRVVADLGGGRVGVVDLQVPAAAQVRMPAPEAETALGKPLPPALDTAQTGVKDAAKAWRDAEVTSDGVRHTTDDTINRLAPDLATATADVATRQGAATTADDNLTAVRDTLPGLQANVNTATQGVTDATTEVGDQVKAQGDAATRADLAADAKTAADNAVTANTTAVADLTTEVGDARTAVDDVNAKVAAAQTALDTHLDAPRPAPADGQLAQPDLVGPRLAGDLADARAAQATEQGRLDELTTELAEAQGKLDQAVIDQGLAVAEVNAAADAVAKADTDHAKAVADLNTAQGTFDTENGRLQTAKDEAQRLQGLLDQANTDLDTAVNTRQGIADEITKAERSLEQARNAADAKQQAWWNAKTAIDQQVDAFNAPAPPVAGSSTTPPAPPTGGVPPIETATPSPSAAPAPAPRGPSPERSFDFAPGSTSLTEQQSATVDALANDLAESVGKRADRGYLPPKVEVSGANAPAVKAALDARLNGAVDVEIAEGGRSDGADVTVDWDLKRPEGYVPPEAPKSVKVTDTVITAGGPQAPHPILSDQSWRHSDAPSADWSRPSNPVSSQDIRAARDAAPVSTVRSEDGGLLSTSTVAPGKVDFKAWRGPIAYDKRSVDVDGVKVQDYTVKVFLDPSTTATTAQVDAVKARTVEGVESMFNQGHRLPSNDQLHVTVEFTDNPADAHGHIAITDPDGRANQLNWPVDTDSRRLAHEVGHFLGLQDEYHETGAAKPIFQHQDGKGRVVADNGPMTAGIDSPTMEIKPRNLWLIETRADALASPNAAPPSASVESSLAPPNAPPPASQPPVTTAQQDMLDVQGAYADAVPAVDPRTSLVNSIAATLKPDSQVDQRALVADIDARTTSPALADVAAAAGARVHVLGADGRFTSHGPITGIPVHVVENGVAGDGARYHATRENVHIGRPGVSYPGPTTVRHQGVLKTVHRGEFEIETIAGRHQVRIYTAVVNPQTITPDATGKPTSQYKDIQQDPATGDLTFSTGKGAGPLWAGAGRPQRALQWLTKYEHTDGGKPVDENDPSSGIKRPVLRSFLVPLDTFNKITSEAKLEGVPAPSANVDQRGEANQFGIGGDHLTALIENAEPGSLTSYPANPAEGFAHEGLAGRITPTTEINGKLGLSPDFRSDAIGKAYDPWFTWKEAADGSWKPSFRNDAHRLHEIATQLREHDVTWQQVRQDPANRTDDARIEPDHESIPKDKGRTDAPTAEPKDLGFDARVQRLNQFLNEVGPASVNVRKITDDVLSTGPEALRAHLAGTDVPDVDQAAYQQALDQIGSEAAQEVARGIDPAIKKVRGMITERAALENLVRRGIPAKNGKPAVNFTEEVAGRVANGFAEKVEAHPSLALLDDASRGRIAAHLRVDMTTAISDNLKNLDGLDAFAKGVGKSAGWLSGPRAIEFGSRVTANMAALPAPTTSVAIDPNLLADVAENKVLAPVVTGALDAFTGQDLVNSSPDSLKSVVSTEVLPKLTTDIRTTLRENPALALADQSFRATMADAVAEEANTRAESALKAFTFDQVNPDDVDALMAKVPEIATQAEIGALISADSDRIAIDFNTRTEGEDPFLNSYFQWNAERGQVFDDQRVAGDELSRSIKSPDRDAHAVVDQLIKRFGELDRKFDEVATAPQSTPFRAPGATTPFTFYEHSQMVLGQYFKLTASENADTRLIPVDALAKAILFHDIEKNNAKNQFGAGQGRHDREPEHKLAAEMMDRYRGLWSNQREFAAARAIVDSDPFGFYLRGKITADEAFGFIHDLAGKIDGTNPDNPKKLFDEFHQYYQADFSSYTPDSTYIDRNEDPGKGPNSFTDRFRKGSDGIELTADNRHFEYAGNHAVAAKMAALTAMFADPATVATHHRRITGQDLTPPSAPARSDAEAYPPSASTPSPWTVPSSDTPVRRGPSPEPDPTTWPERRTGIDATALAPPSVAEDHDGWTRSITGDLFSEPANLV